MVIFMAFGQNIESPSCGQIKALGVALLISADSRQGAKGGAKNSRKQRTK